MSTNAPRRIVTPLVASVVLAMTAVALAQSPAPPSPSTTKRLSRSEHLRDWLAAVERHEPGLGDEAMSVFDSWRPDDYQYLQIDLDTLFAVMADPGLRTFYRKQDGRSASVHIVYSGSDLRVILEVAREAIERRGGVITLPAERAARVPRVRNHILKRAAILHTDIAIEAFASGRTRNVRAPAGLQSFTLLLPDGRAQGIAVDIGHWDLARSFLSKVVPSAAHDDFVRRWYAATGAYLEALGQLAPTHFARGLALFPDDAELLFFAGCLHESLGEPRIQDAIQNAPIPGDVRFDVSSRRAEVREAESLLRKALKRSPDHVEARIHLGRILGVRGEHAEAEGLLRGAATDAKDPLLQYYAQLFLGSEKEALGDRETARGLYERASELYPVAQSPRLALSMLSTFDRRHTDAVAMISMVLGAPRDERADPWWTYHQSPGRNAAVTLQNIYNRFVDEDRR